MSTAEGDDYTFSAEDESLLAHDLADHLMRTLEHYRSTRPISERLGVSVPLVASMTLMARLVAEVSRQTEVSQWELTEMVLRQLRGILRRDNGQ
jgi:hypothetical protein